MCDTTAYNEQRKQHNNPMEGKIFSLSKLQSHRTMTIHATTATATTTTTTTTTIAATTTDHCSDAKE